MLVRWKRSSRSWPTPKPGEVKALTWSFAYFFFLLSTYYMLLPLRDAMGMKAARAGCHGCSPHLHRDADHRAAAGGGGGETATREIRSGHLPVPGREHAVVLVPDELWDLPIAWRAPFFIWTMVSPVFTILVFWSFMADLYSSEQSKRLLGFIGAGGSIGSIVGPVITRQLVEPIGVATCCWWRVSSGCCRVLRQPSRGRSAGGAGRHRDFVAASANRPSSVAAACSMASCCCSNPPIWVASVCGCPAVVRRHLPVLHPAGHRRQRRARRRRAHQFFATVAQWVGIRLW